MEQSSDEYRKYQLIGSKRPESVFKVFSTGAKSNRDEIVYGFKKDELSDRVRKFTEAFNSEVDRYRRTEPKQAVDGFVDYSRLKWSSTLKMHLQRGNYAAYDEKKIRVALYRPYTKQYLYYDPILNDRPGLNGADIRRKG